jgi:hypothetical protein
VAVCGSAAMCGSVSSSVLQCAQQCVAVHAAVCGSVPGSVRLSGSAALCSSVQQCVAVRAVRQCEG